MVDKNNSEIKQLVNSNLLQDEVNKIKNIEEKEMEKEKENSNLNDNSKISSNYKGLYKSFYLKYQ